MNQIVCNQCHRNRVVLEPSRNNLRWNLWMEVTMYPKSNPCETGTDQANRAVCPGCKGRGLFFKTDDHRTDVFCCDGCDAGRLIWSRALELLADMDRPSPIEHPPEIGDSVVRGILPRKYPLALATLVTRIGDP